MSISEFIRQIEEEVVEPTKVFGIFEECLISVNGKLEKEMVFCPVYGVSEDKSKIDKRCQRLNADCKSIDNDKNYFTVIPITLI